jgi:membrane associated rhomboid family serine protease
VVATTDLSTPNKRSQLLTGVKLTASLIVAMWTIEIVDTFVLASWLQSHGIFPRSVSGLPGILFAPWLHGDFAHLMANTVPFAVLGLLIMLRGPKTFLGVSAFITIVGGSAVWLMARQANHIGASGVVFGYLGFLVAVGIVERRLTSIAVSALVGFAYGGLIWGVLPSQPGVSWESHLFGALAGIAAARVFARRK